MLMGRRGVCGYETFPSCLSDTRTTQTIGSRPFTGTMYTLLPRSSVWGRLGCWLFRMSFHELELELNVLFARVYKRVHEREPLDRVQLLTMPGKVAKSAFSLEELPTSISKIFDQAQISTANHHKNFVALYKLQCEAAKLTDQRGKGIKLTGERAFGDVYLKMLARILPVKKGATVVDRVVKFVSGYIKFINEKGVLRVLSRMLGRSLPSKLPKRKQRTRLATMRMMRRRRRLVWCRVCSSGCSMALLPKTKLSAIESFSSSLRWLLILVK
jgi:hypothetical protein